MVIWCCTRKSAIKKSRTHQCHLFVKSENEKKCFDKIKKRLGGSQTNVKKTHHQSLLFHPTCPFSSRKKKKKLRQCDTGLSDISRSLIFPSRRRFETSTGFEREDLFVSKFLENFPNFPKRNLESKN